MYGKPVAWCSRVQCTISESTSEAELKAVCEAVKDILFLKLLTEELLYPVVSPIPLYEDNIGALRHSQLYASRNCIQHLELCYFKVREYVQSGVIKIEKVVSEEQLADTLTKPLPETVF